MTLSKSVILAITFLARHIPTLLLARGPRVAELPACLSFRTSCVGKIQQDLPELLDMEEVRTAARPREAPCGVGAEKDSRPCLITWWAPLFSHFS